MASLSSYYPQPLPIGTTSESVVVATGSSASRSLGDRFGEVFHVDDYGAKGDWNGTAGTDDTAAIQAAINAAVAADGGDIVFSPNKTYYCNTRTIPTAGHVAIGKHLDIMDGSPTMRLRFVGNKARLYSGTYNVNGCDLIYSYARFHTLEFCDLIFERAPHTKTASGSPTTGVRIIPYDSNPVEKIGFYGCSFIDCNNAIVTSVTPTSFDPISGRFRKCKRFECVSCSFLYYRGGSHATTWGDVTVNLTHWIEHAVFDRVYFDGLVGGQLPEGVFAGKDGFLFPAPKHLHVTNSFFTNYQFEGFKLQTTNEGSSMQLRLNPFDQVEIGSNVTATIYLNPSGLDFLESEKTYGIYAPSFFNASAASAGGIGRVGFYELVSAADGFETGEDIVLKRVDGEKFAGRSFDATVGSNRGPSPYRVIAVEENNVSSNFTNNTFYNVTLKKADGEKMTSNEWAAPCILSGKSLAASNNTFYGGAGHIVMDPYTWDNNKPTVISNNLMYVYTDFDNRPNTPMLLYQPNCIISNNQIVVQNPKDIVYAILLQNDDVVIVGNSMVVLETATVAEKTRFLNLFHILGVPFRILVENNYLKNVDCYINGVVPQVVGPFLGEINDTVAVSGGEDVLAKIRVLTNSPDGTKKYLKVENNGTITVEA